MIKPLKIVDLFCGAGGWSQGLIKAGHEIILSIDNWEPAVNTYKKNIGDHVIQKEITEELLDDKHIMNKIREADIIIGSPPCKTFSPLNKNKTDDLTLTRIYFKLVGDKPFIMENVAPVYKQMKKSNLIDDNYFAKIIEMSDYGVPQVRRRFILSNFFDLNSVPKPKSSENKSYYKGMEDYIKLFDDIPEEFKIKDTPSHQKHIVERMKTVKNGTSWKDFGVYYRVPKTGISYTIVNVTKSMMIHPTENRRLSVQEAAIIQTFPPSYDFQGTVADIGNQVGNAVPPKFAEFIGHNLNDQLQRHNSRHKQLSLDIYNNK